MEFMMEENTEREGKRHLRTQSWTLFEAVNISHLIQYCFALLSICLIHIVVVKQIIAYLMAAGLQTFDNRPFIAHFSLHGL